jgi:hypothetical protein
MIILYLRNKIIKLIYDDVNRFIQKNKKAKVYLSHLLFWLFVSNDDIYNYMCNNN